ncbi:MAG: SPOR domain-containing protein [Ignavibacteriae bacterium]|nr:SPOR domain-containing protein [Ignavibacteriota bacterium]
MILILGGCKSADEHGSQRRSPSTLREFLLKHEATFNPVRYDSVLALHKDSETRGALNIRTVAMTALPETTSGFRAQILFTQDIDQANQLRDTLDSILPNEWVYIVYDAPYYKVRAGNYDDRTSAARMVKHLSSFGFKDAWIVPDKILKNIPSKPPVADIEAIPRLQAQQ